MAKEKRPLLTRPAGPSELFSIGNLRGGTSAAVTCELCGTEHPELSGDDYYSLFTLFGREGVLDCCGKIIDNLFHEWGYEFTKQKLAEFRKSPLDSKFGSLRFLLQDVAKQWQQAAVAAVEQSHEVAAAVPER